MENREALSDLASLGHLSQRERQVTLFDKLKRACFCGTPVDRYYSDMGSRPAA